MDKNLDYILAVLFVALLTILIIIGSLVAVQMYQNMHGSTVDDKHEIAEPAPLTEAEFKLLQETLRLGERVEELETALRAHIDIGHQKTGSKE